MSHKSKMDSLQQKLDDVKAGAGVLQAEVTKAQRIVGELQEINQMLVGTCNVMEQMLHEVQGRSVAAIRDEVKRRVISKIRPTAATGEPA